MATRTISSPEPFSRIVDERPTSSWRAAIPAAIIVIAAVIAAAYFAARASELSQQLASTRTEMAQQTQSVAQLQARTATLDTDLTRLRTAGRTTVILKPAATKARKGAETPSSSWGAATWGEQGDGKTWIRLDAYGLAQPPQGKAYQAWFEGTEGAPVLVAKLDAAPDGSAFAEGKDLPALDQGKLVLISLDDDGAKNPGQHLVQADLPKLKPSASAPSTQAATPSAGASQGATPAAGAAQGAGAGGSAAKTQ